MNPFFSTTILLVDDHALLREGLRRLLGQEPDFKVLADVGEGRSAVRLAQELSPDVVIMDLHIPDLSGIDATRQIVAQSPRVRVIGLTGEVDPRMTGELLRAGATACVRKEKAYAELAQAIRGARSGDTLSGRDDGPGLFAPAACGTATLGPPAVALSPREREVLKLVADGQSTKQVARSLGVSIKTIESHRRNMMEKLHIDNVAGLTKYALREGLTAL